MRSRVLASIAVLVCTTSFTIHAADATAAPAKQPVGGEAAIALLGVDTARVADTYDMTPAELKSELREDDTLKVDGAKRLLFIDPPHAHTEPVGGHAPAAKAAAAPTAQAAYPYGGGDYTTGDTFMLHSKPSAPVVIYLDFNGHTTTGTAWNSTYGSTIVSNTLNHDGDASTFSAAERTVIAKVWAGVAEDYAPFNVDVTTQEPNVEMLKKSSSTDANYGIRVVVTPTGFVQGAGGVAYLGSFSWSSDTPAFAFAANYAPDDMVEVITHEVGHSFNLRHDGTTAGVEYYTGQGDWAPIMGVGYYKTVTQWSKGEYTNANNKEDDTAIIAQTAPLISDDYTDTKSAALTISDLSTRGVISTPEDKDWFSFSFGGGALRVKVAPAFYANLDAAVELYRGSTLVQRLDPTGLSVDSTLSSLPAGSYQLMIEGTGVGSATAIGYSDYGSLGEYLLTLEGSVSVDPPATINVATSTTFATLGSTVTFSASSSSHPTFNGVTLSWSFSDGTSATTATVSKVMPNSSLTATLTATTTNGGVTVTTATVRLASRPTVTASATPLSLRAGSTATFTAVGTDPDRQTLSYSWAFSDGTSATGATATKIPQSAGTLTGTVTVTDTDGLTGTATISVAVVTNLPPTLTLSVATLPAAAPANLTFKATAADPERTAVSYLWVFPDGSRSTTATAVRAFTQAGTYTVTATATDTGGAATTKNLVFTVGPNTAPVIGTVTVTPTSQAAPASFTFKASATDADRHTLTYAWVFAGGTTATGQTASLKNLTTPGTYTATVTVTDTGGLTATRNVTYTVTPNRAPTVSIATVTPTTMAAPATLTFSATGSDPDSQALTYAWTFPDGSTSTAKAVKKTVTAPGTYTATVTVTDTGGLTATRNVTYTVTANRAPTVVTASVSASTLPAGQSRVFTASASDADNQTLKYKWVFGDGSTSTAASVTKTFRIAGTYTATLTVTDTGGLTATRSVPYTVT